MQSERIETAKAELELKTSIFLKRIAGLDNSKYNLPMSKGKWSYNQLLHHLMTVEAGSLQYIEKKCQNPDNIPFEGRLDFLKMLFLKTILNSNIKFKAPKVLGEPPVDLVHEELIEKWKLIRVQLIDFIEKLPSELEPKAIYKHPFIGRISGHNMFRFLSMHIYHHQKQVDNFLKKA